MKYHRTQMSTGATAGLKRVHGGWGGLKEEQKYEFSTMSCIGLPKPLWATVLFSSKVGNDYTCFCWQSYSTASKTPLGFLDL